MMKFLTVLFCLTIAAFGCTTAKRAQKSEAPILKADTTTVIESKDTVATVASVSAVPATQWNGTDVYNKILKNKIDYTTFNAKVRVEYSSKEGSDNATAYIRLKKDSAVWLSLRGPLGIEGFRIVITRDSVKVLNLLKKQVELKSIDFLQQIIGLPFDLSTVQDFIVGNPVFTDSNVVSYKADNNIQVLMIGSSLRNLVTLNGSDYKILHSKLEDNSATGNRTCDISLEGYENKQGFAFSTQRKVSVKGPSEIDMTFDFKQYSFDQPVTFPFNIPKNYKRL